MYNAHLHILHVAKEPALPSFNGASPGTDNLPAIRRQGHEDELTRFVVRWLPHQTKVIQALKFGIAYKEIVRYARHEDIDLIVIATHGRTGLNHLMMGSVAEKVVRFSPVPVLTVKPQLQQSNIPNADRATAKSTELHTHEYSR